MSVADISVHESVWPSRWRTSLIDCLRRRSLDARFHYESPAQTGAWLALHEAHSPARSDPAVARLYPDAIGGCLSRMPAPARLASLGCGGGQKDLDVLCACGASAYAAIDVAPGMVIDLPIPAYLPDDWIPEMALRLQIYRRIGALSRVDDVNALRDELRDRFGLLPLAVDGLLFQIEVKLLAQRAGATGVQARDTMVRIKLPYLAEVNRDALAKRLGSGISVTRTAVEFDQDREGLWRLRLIDVLDQLHAERTTALAEMTGA